MLSAQPLPVRSPVPTGCRKLATQGTAEVCAHISITPRSESLFQFLIDLVCRPIHRAGYAYVGPLGPKVDEKHFSEAELDGVHEEIKRLLSNIRDISYDEFVADTQCQW